MSSAFISSKCLANAQVDYDVLTSKGRTLFGFFGWCCNELCCYKRMQHRDQSSDGWYAAESMHGQHQSAESLQGNHVSKVHLGPDLRKTDLRAFPLSMVRSPSLLGSSFSQSAEWQNDNSQRRCSPHGDMTSLVSSHLLYAWRLECSCSIAWKSTWPSNDDTCSATHCVRLG